MPKRKRWLWFWGDGGKGGKIVISNDSTLCPKDQYQLGKVNRTKSFPSLIENTRAIQEAGVDIHVVLTDNDDTPED